MRHLLALLPKPSRYLGIEEGSVHKNPQDVSLHVGLAFPDLYEVAMSYLGQKVLYSIINQHPRWYAERVFTPCRDAVKVLKEHKAPLCTLESDTPLAQLDLLGFSLTHELCYTNVLLMLDLAGLPLRQKERDANHPLIVAGGGCTLAAEPLAPFIDLMLLGDGEELIVDLLQLLQQSKKANWARSKLLSEAAKIPGVYVPSISSTPPTQPLPPTLEGEQKTEPNFIKPGRRIVANLNLAPYPDEQVVPFGAVHNRLALEIARGCTRGCRFCQAGMLYRPVRERSVDTLQALTERCLNSTGYDDLSFLSLSTGDFSALKTLFVQVHERCAAEQVSLSLPSLRVGSIDDEIMQRVAGIRRTGATLAPEAGSQRLRDVINKGITEEELLAHVRKLFAHGWQQVKLYFMIGLPSETDADLEAIVDLCCKVRDVAGPGVKRLQVTAAISTFVPKAHTPFQWEAQISLPEIQRRIDYLLQRFKAEKCLTMRWHEPGMSFLEGIFSRGDRRLADVVELAYQKGDLFTAWLDDFSLEPWLEAMRECGLDPMEYTGSRNPNLPLPWDHLESGLSPNFLLKEREKALLGETSLDCRYNSCLSCGVCDQGSRASRLPKPAFKTMLDAVPGAVLGAEPGGKTPPANEADQLFCNRLNFSRRDQTDLLTENSVVSSAPLSKQPDEHLAATPFAPAQPQTPARGKTKNRPPEIAAELAHKAAIYRIWYAKEERAVFLSQLDLQAVFERAFRRAALPLAFSQGFRPMPLLSFGRALPVGVSSQAEWCAITLRSKILPETMLKSLQKSFPKGLKILYIEELPVQKNLPQALFETYALKLAENSPLDFDKLLENWQAFMQKESCLLTRDTKKGERTVNLRQFVLKIHPDAARQCLYLDFDWREKYLSPLTICLAINPALSVTDIQLSKLAQRFTEPATE